jgi:adenylate cyclase
MKTLSQWAKKKWMQAVGLGLASALLVLGAMRLDAYLAQHQSDQGRQQQLDKRANRLGLFGTLENKSLDWRIKALTPVTHPSDIVILAVDDQSFDSPEFLEDFGRYPPRRLLYAGLVHYLRQWGARAIAFDIIFQGRTLQGDDDARLAQVLSQQPDVVLGFTLNNANDPVKDEPILKGLEARLQPFASKPGQNAALNLESYTGADLPEDFFMKAVPALGCTTALSDSDGLVRRATPLYRFGDRLYPSLSLAVASMVTGNKPIKLEPGPKLEVAGHSVPLDPKGQMLIRWYGPAYTFTHYSAWRVFNSAQDYDGCMESGKSGEDCEEKIRQENKITEVAPQLFKDKIVLIAVTAVGAGDIRPTAFSENYPGVEGQATLISDLLHGNFLRATDPRVAVAAVFILALLASALVYSFDSALAYSTLSLGVGSAYFGVVCWLFRSQSLVAPMVTPLTAGATAFLAATLTRYATEGREKKQYRKTLMKYLSPSLVETIMTDMDWANLRAEKKTLTVLFSDIRGFTTFSEQNPAETVVATLNEHLNMMVSVIFKYQGTLDKFVGDCVMAFWGAPLAQPNHAELAARAGLEMIEGLEKLNQKWQSEGRPTLHVGVGINTGEMLFGNIGSEQRMDFTVIGDSVNLGSRLESATKELHASIVISEATYGEIQPLADVKPLGEIHVKGKEKGIVVYELLGMTSAPGRKSEPKLKEVAS